VVAALRENRENEQIRIREQPLVGFRAGRFRGARDKAQVAAPREVPEVLQTNPGQPRDFVFGEKLLTRPDRQHVSTSPLLILMQSHRRRCTELLAIVLPFHIKKRMVYRINKIQTK